MNRLTTNREISNGNKIYFPFTHKESVFTNIVRKLGQLEDIEEELGIDLVTLFKALKYGVVTYDEISHDFFYDSELALVLETYEREKYPRLVGIDTYYLNDYGKTWALSEKELENDK